MYESFYGLREKPFSLSPDPEYLYLSRQHARALTLIEYGLVNQAGFVVLTGEIGAGKTTLVRRVLQDIDEQFTIGIVSNTHCESFDEMLRWVLLAFGREYRGGEKVELYHNFTAFLIQEREEGRRPVLIVDEAQGLDKRALEQLRMLSNVNVDKDQLLQMILVGQPGLWELLRTPELEQFAQRVAVDFHIDSLPREEADEYIAHRLRVAGASERIFDEGALSVIWETARGLPRLINLICDTALVYGFSDGQRRIGADLIREVVADKRRSLSPLGQGGNLDGGGLKPVSLDKISKS